MTALVEACFPFLIQAMSSAKSFHQAEDPVFLEPEFHAELTGGYQTSNVFSRDFLQPHDIPLLANWSPVLPTFDCPHAGAAERPKSPSGATYMVPRLPQELKDYLFARSLLAPSYEHVFDKHDPEESSKKHMAELCMLVGAAKDEMKEAYQKVVDTGEEYSTTVEAQQMEMSRWKANPRAAKSDETAFMPEELAKRGKRGKKEGVVRNTFQGKIMTFQ